MSVRCSETVEAVERAAVVDGRIKQFARRSVCRLIVLHVEEHLDRVSGAHAAAEVGVEGMDAQHLQYRIRLHVLDQRGVIETGVNRGILAIFTVGACGLLELAADCRLGTCNELAGRAAVDRDEMVVTIREDRERRRLLLVCLGERGHQRDADFLTRHERALGERAVAGFDHGPRLPGIGACALQDLGERVVASDLDDADFASFEILFDFFECLGNFWDRRRVRKASAGRIRCVGRGFCHLRL